MESERLSLSLHSQHCEVDISWSPFIRLGNQGESASNLPGLPEFVGEDIRIETRSVWFQGEDDRRMVKVKGGMKLAGKRAWSQTLQVRG